ncbi:TonB-dependent receptor [Hellea sp.]|nr:TonB-dependent receptor [Hellea sp.]
MNILDKTRLLQTSILSSLIMGLGGAAYAQVQQVPADDQAQEEAAPGEIIVTGSRIKRQIGDSPVPLTIIDQEDVAISGFNDLADFLSDVPALQGSQVPDDTTGAVLNAAGLSVLNLRQLGANRTLVLIDGQRQVGSVSGSASVDIGTIPFIAIDQTEVLTGGASAIYGADAVSGVVNFQTRKNFDGIEIDAQFAEDEFGNGDGYRLSSVIGKNFQEDKGNILFAAEYRKTSQLSTEDLDFLSDNVAFIRLDNDDVDPATADDLRPESIPDGQPNFGLFPGATLDIINNAGIINLFTTSAVNPTGNNITFGPGGVAIPFNRGTDPRTGALIGSSNTLIGGDGVLIDSNDLAGTSLTPANETYNILARISYDLFDNVGSYVEARYSNTQADSAFQPSFISGSPFTIGSDVGDDRLLGGPTFGRNFFTGTDNAFLDPAAAAAIDNAFGVGDFQRFQAEFNRAQSAERELFRIVGGLNGDFASPIGGADDWSWRIDGNYGRSTATNQQLNVRLNDNFFAGADAIRISQQDLATLAAAGNAGAFQGGEVVCRVQFLQAAGLSTDIPGIGAISQNTIDACVPFSVFGDNAITGDALEFVSADLNDRFEQQQFIASGSLTGDIGDLWGAGATGFAIGAEYRQEKSATNPDPLPLNVNTFANVIQPTTGEFDVYEIFGEVNIPLIKDFTLIERLSVGGALRYSDYSTIGSTTTYNINGEYTPFDGLDIRGGYARAIRAPNIGELFQAPAQSFFQITDPCDIVLGIPNAQNPAIREANCAADGVAGFSDPNPNISNSGVNAGNPGLSEETSDTYFAGFTYRPSFLPDFIMDVNYFNIDIEGAIAGVGVQNILNNCYDGAAGLDPNFCNLFERDANNGNEIANILNAPVNIGGFATEGIDFQAVYRKDLADLFGGSEDIGSLSIGVLGTYLIGLDNQTDPNDDSTFDDSAGEVGVPEIRFAVNTSYNYKKITFTHSLDFQGQQDVFQDSIDRNSPDIAGFRQTPVFDQHDFSVRYEWTDNFTMRGGIVNAFDKEPPLFAQNNIFDFFGRRFFIGATANF